MLCQHLKLSSWPHHPPLADTFSLKLRPLAFLRSTICHSPISLQTGSKQSLTPDLLLPSLIQQPLNPVPAKSHSVGYSRFTLPCCLRNHVTKSYWSLLKKALIHVSFSFPPFIQVRFSKNMEGEIHFTSLPYLELAPEHLVFPLTPPWAPSPHLRSPLGTP